MTPYLLINPHVKNTGRADVAYVSNTYPNAREGHDLYLRVRSNLSNLAFVKASAGFVGVSDGCQDLTDNDGYGEREDNGGTRWTPTSPRTCNGAGGGPSSPVNEAITSWNKAGGGGGITAAQLNTLRQGTFAPWSTLRRLRISVAPSTRSVTFSDRSRIATDASHSINAGAFIGIDVPS